MTQPEADPRWEGVTLCEGVVIDMADIVLEEIPESERRKLDPNKISWPEGEPKPWENRPPSAPPPEI